MFSNLISFARPPMLALLNQILNPGRGAPSASSAPQHFVLQEWVPHSYEWFAAGITFVVILVGGWLVTRLFRPLLNRYEILKPVRTGIFFAALNAALWALEPRRLMDLHDTLTIYIRDIFVFIFMLVGLRLLDRLFIIPLLTRGRRSPLSRFIHQIVLIIVYIFAFLVYCSWAFGLNIDKFLAGSAVISIVLGLALQETLGNFFSGMVMQASSPFAIGHWITCAGSEGRVVDMTWRAVTLHTLDDNFVLIPNSLIAREQIVNFNNPTANTARTVQGGIEYGTAPERVREVLMKAALETPGVLAQPSPVVFLTNFGGSSIDYTLKFWINDARQHLNIESRVRVNMWYRVKQAGMNMPCPIRTVEITSLDRKESREAHANFQERLEALGRAPLLASLKPEQRELLAREACQLLLAPDQIVYKANDGGDSMYIVERGTLDVFFAVGDKPATKVGQLQAGQVFGEMSALTGEPRQATVKAATEAACVELTHASLQNIFQQDPALLEALGTLVADHQARREELVREHETAAAASATSAVERQTMVGRMRRLFGAR